MERYVKARKIEICQGLYERYSNLTLSFEADRPIAIRGLEARLVSTLNTVGGYGMFERFLHRCLLWRRSGDTLKRIQLFRGETVPSWSWMAYTGGICYMNVPFGDVSWNKEIVSPFSNNSSEDSALKMPVIKAQAWDLVDTEKHILVLDEPGRFIDDPLKQNKYVEVFDKEGDEVGELKCVIVGTSKGSTPVRDIQSTSDQEHTYYVLIIAPAGGSQSNLYERVGIAELEGQHVALSKASIDVCIQ